MAVELKKLNFRMFAKNKAKMYDLLDANRAILVPWFWWANEKVTPNKFRFYLFMILSIADTKRKKIAHKLNPENLYDEQFVVYDCQEIGGLCGLDNIDTKNNHNAEMWGLAFKGHKETIETAKLLEKYCVDVLGLKSFYGKVQSENRASRFFWVRYGYDSRIFEENVRVSPRNPNISDMYTYTKQLVK